LTTATTYRYQVRATDSAGNLSDYSNAASATTPDNQAPTAPGSLTTTLTSASQAHLAWTASSDNVGVTAYAVERCQNAGCGSFAQVATVAGLTFDDSGLSASTSYSYRVRATDAAANVSGYSNVSTVTTPAPPDTLPPTQPGSLAGTAPSTSQVSLTWTASSDNVGVAGYQVSRNGALIGTVTTLSYVDNGLAASTTYNYAV